MIIAIGGGKGGTGKSFVSTNLAAQLAKQGFKVLLVDADVESPVDHLLLGIKKEKLDKITSFLPKILPDKCTKCYICVQKCPEHALISPPKSVPILLPDLCSGCSVCKLVCPTNAIVDDERLLGFIYSGSKNGLDFLQGEAIAGVKQTISVVKPLIEMLNKYKNEYDFIVIDSAPGTGAMLWLILRSSDLVISVTEPTPLGVADLKRFLRLIKDMDKDYFVVINKATLDERIKMEIYTLSEGRPIFEIPYDEKIISRYVRGVPIVYDESPELKHIRKTFEALARSIISSKQ